MHGAWRSSSGLVIRESAEHLALGICESIRDGEMALTVEDDVVVMSTKQGDVVTVALADLR